MLRQRKVQYARHSPDRAHLLPTSCLHPVSYTHLITIRMILEPLESSMSLLDGPENGASSLRSFLNREVWSKVDQAVAGLLDATTVADLMREFENRDHAVDSSSL